MPIFTSSSWPYVVSMNPPGEARGSATRAADPVATRATRMPAAAVENLETDLAARAPRPDRAGSTRTRPTRPPSQTLPASRCSMSAATRSASGLLARVCPIRAGTATATPAAITATTRRRRRRRTPAPEGPRASARPPAMTAGTANSVTGSDDQVLPRVSRSAPPVEQVDGGHRECCQPRRDRNTGTDARQDDRSVAGQPPTSLGAGRKQRHEGHQPGREEQSDIAQPTHEGECQRHLRAAPHHRSRAA